MAATYKSRGRNPVGQHWGVRRISGMADGRGRLQRDSPTAAQQGGDEEHGEMQPLLPFLEGLEMNCTRGQIGMEGR